MKQHRLIALAAVLTAGVALPALAQGYRGDHRWDRLGTVEFSFRNDRATQYGNFGGSVEALKLDAVDGDVVCRNVRVTFANGRTRDVFSGRIARGRDRVIDLPGNDRNIRRIDFTCHSEQRRGSRVDIAADIGRYRAEWRASPNWSRFWANAFPWANDRDDDRWIRVSTERFEGGRDRETAITGWRGRNIDSVGFRAVDGDARCNRVLATFANGRTQRLDIRAGDRLRQGRLYQVDLPGNQRDMVRIEMTCRGIGQRAVTIQVLANR
jgi:hypothetical protein